jgi:hypothetical protein
MGTNNDNRRNNREENLNGTLVSVLLLGAVLALSWLGAYAIFLNRG